MIEPQPGDFILYPCDPRSAFSSRFVGAGELLVGLGGHGREKQMYSHAAIMGYTPGYQYEAKFPFTGHFKIDKSRVYEVWRIGSLSANQRHSLIDWCENHVGDLYNLIGVLTCGLIELPGTYYCSQFACLAYASVGLHPGDSIMSPNSIPEYPGARMIYRYTPPEDK